MNGGTEKEFFAIPENLKKLNGVEAGGLMMSSKVTLSKDDRSAAIDAAARNIEQKQIHSEDLKNMLKGLNVSDKEILARIVSRQINEVLG